MAAYHWDQGCSCLKDPENRHGSDLLLNGQAPRAGDVMTMPLLASTFEVSLALKMKKNMEISDSHHISVELCTTSP